MSDQGDRPGGGTATEEPTAGRDPGIPGAAGPEAGDRDMGAAGPAAEPNGGRRARRGRTALELAVLTAVVVVPMVIAAAAVRTPRWYPLVDLVQIEMRVRDVGLSHPPLVGLGGRIFGLGTQGSHPGPLSFYLLAPVYRLMGSSSWGLQVSDAVLNVGVVAATLWATHRRLGLRGALVMAGGLAFLMRLYTPGLLVYPWNPFMPVLFWVLFLVCVWGVLCDDLAVLPVAVVAGSLCAQTHVPYVGLVGGMAVLVVGALALSWRRRAGDAAARRALVRWTGGSLALGALLWLPVFVQQLGGDPGNLSILIANFRHPSDPNIGPGDAVRYWLHHLDVVNLVRGSSALGGSLAPGVVLLVAWAGAAALALWLGERTLIRLHVVVGAALALGLAAISRIFGPPWYYLMLWAWGTAALAVVAIGATGLAVVTGGLRRRTGAPAPAPGDGDGAAPEPAEATGPGGWLPARLAWLPVAALVTLVVVPTGLAARSAPDTQNDAMDLSDQLGEMVGPTVRAIDDGEVAGGPHGTFLVTWTDPVNLGGQGQGLLLELERRGYRARADRGNKLAVRPHRLIDPADADAELHVAVGTDAIAQAEDHPGAVRLAHVDPRTDSERATFERLRAEVIDGLRAAGLDDMAAEVDTNFFGMAADPRLPVELRAAVYAMGQVHPPVAVYTWSLGGGG
jgi:hypothetical protein